jgi:6-pyruvoyltetrahydropterin/6-carboxytetrahydropterin synthase
MILLTRKAEFSSAHYYWNEAWSQEENEQVFGKCANKNGHGHNYTLEVTVAGEVDVASGFVVDLKELKDAMEREVVSVYDHRHLNYGEYCRRDMASFAGEDSGGKAVPCACV